MITVNLPPGKQYCVYVDTEQSNYDVWRVVKRILKGSGCEHVPINFAAYGMRKYPPKERLFLIEKLIYSREDIGIMVIDGIRDLVNDINSPDEATEIASKLMKWTSERNIHLITVLHQNKGDNNARGHLGTELVNKAETVVSVDKKLDLSIVSPEAGRGRDFTPFAFSVDADGIPYIIEQFENKNTSDKKAKLEAQDIPVATHYKILKELFEDLGTDKLNRSELESHVKVKFQANAVRLVDTQVIDFISYYKQKKLLLDEGTKGRQGNLHWLNKDFQF